MKVVFFIQSLAVGGSQRQVAALARGLARRSHDVAVVVLYAGGPLERGLAGDGVSILSLGKRVISQRDPAGVSLRGLSRLFRCDPHLEGQPPPPATRGVSVAVR